MEMCCLWTSPPKSLASAHGLTSSFPASFTAKLWSQVNLDHTVHWLQVSPQCMNPVRGTTSFQGSSDLARWVYFYYYLSLIHHHYILGREKLLLRVKVASGQSIFLEKFVLGCFFFSPVFHTTITLEFSAVLWLRHSKMEEIRSTSEGIWALAIICLPQMGNSQDVIFTYSHLQIYSHFILVLERTLWTFSFQ